MSKNLDPFSPCIPKYQREHKLHKSFQDKLIFCNMKNLNIYWKCWILFIVFLSKSGCISWFENHCLSQMEITHQDGKETFFYCRMHFPSFTEISTIWYIDCLTFSFDFLCDLEFISICTITEVAENIMTIIKWLYFFDPNVDFSISLNHIKIH